MEIGTTITPDRFKQLLAEVATECARRQYYGSVALYADRANNALNNNDFDTGSVIPEQVFYAIEEPMTAINYTDNPATEEHPIIIKDAPLSNIEANLAVYKTYPIQGVNTGCSSNCTGLCYTQCTGGCASGCSGACGGACSNDCSGGCSGSCSGSCSGCSGGCSGKCSGGCMGCTNCTGCSGSCSGNCKGCSGCGNGCTSGCSGGCTGACSGYSNRGSNN